MSAARRKRGTWTVATLFEAVKRNGLKKRTPPAMRTPAGSDLRPEKRIAMTMIEPTQKSNPSRRRGPKPGTLVLKKASETAQNTGPEDVLPPDPKVLTRAVDPRSIVTSTLNVPHREPTPELILSVRTHGIIEPPIVRPITPRLATVEDLPRRPWIDGEEHLVEYELVIGERRWKSAMICEQRSVLVIVRNLSDEEAFDLAVAENLEREDLDPLQEAELCATHRDRFKRDVNEIALRMQRGARWVQQRLMLLRLHDDARKALREGRLYLVTALELAMLDDAHRAEGLAMVLRGPTDPPMPVREARALLTKRFHMLMVHVPFDAGDATLVPGCGPCTTCPKRTGTQIAMSIEGLDDLDRCTDRACWEEKSNATWRRRAQAARESGVLVFDTKADGPPGEAARLVLVRPEKRGFVNLDAVCQVARDAAMDRAREDAREHLAEAELGGDADQIAEAEHALHNVDADVQAAEAVTWRKVLGDAAAPVAIVREERQGRDNVVELVDERGALEVLAAAGLELPPEVAEKLGTTAGPPKKKASAAAWEVEERAQRIWIGRVIEATVPAAEKARAWQDATVLRGLVTALAAVLPRAEITMICDRRGWRNARSQGETVPDAFARHVAELRDGALRGLLVELVAASCPEAARAIGEAFGLEVGQLVAAAKKAASTTLATTPSTLSAPSAPACRKCGCDDLHACRDTDGMPCSWVEPDLCSKCAGTRNPKLKASKGLKASKATATGKRDPHDPRPRSPAEQDADTARDGKRRAHAVGST